MCMVCYLSTDRDIADRPFDENNRQFNVCKTDERPSCLSKRFVYYCGSRQSCGCGFGNLGITEDILQRTEKELLAGKLSKETEMIWWDQFSPPPQSPDEFYKQASEIRDSNKDTLALYQLIRETWETGYLCEVLIYWSGGDENNPVDEIREIDLGRELIALDFAAHTGHIPVRLYRFPKNTNN